MYQLKNVKARGYTNKMFIVFFLFFYEIIQIVVFFILSLFSFFLFNRKLNRFLALRNPIKFFQNINKSFDKYNSLLGTNKDIKIFWFHVSSAGEMEQAIPVARKLNEQLGAYFFITYYSFSAEPFLKNFPATIGYSGLPLDIRFLYKKIFKKLPISKIFFVRYDIWPSLLLSCKSNNLEINLMCATKIKTKKGFHAFLSQSWNRLFYKYFSHIFCVSLDDVSYFKDMLPQSQIYLAGDAKWARANERAHSHSKMESDPNFKLFLNSCGEIKNTHHKKIIVIGSPHKEEHELVLLLSKLKQYFLLIYVPHEVNQKSIQSLYSNLGNMGYKPSLYSTFTEETKVCDTIIVDKIGYLAEIYQIADVAIIGGGFDGQIHNVLEAAAAGAATLFGSSYSRAREAWELVQAKAALSFESINEMFHFLSLWVNFKNELNDSRGTIENPEDVIYQLKETRNNALLLFQNLPSTSEVILNAIKKA